jgi:hypothetical protein
MSQRCFFGHAGHFCTNPDLNELKNGRRAFRCKSSLRCGLFTAIAHAADTMI